MLKSTTATIAPIPAKMSPLRICLEPALNIQKDEIAKNNSNAGGLQKVLSVILSASGTVSAGGRNHIIIK
jgi:hypothetical protein